MVFTTDASSRPALTMTIDGVYAKLWRLEFAMEAQESLACDPSGVVAQDAATS